MSGESPQAGFLTIGLGASAGGIKALREFFQQVPADSGFAFVVILHLSPDHDSRLAEVLQSTASIPVIQVKERVQVDPNTVYVIPPNQSLTIADGHLVLSDITRIEERRAPVDVFFRTLAESVGSSAVAVILSGTGANGSMGIKRVRELGGLCIVQDPNEAEYSDMPRHSIATGLVDDVLPVAQIPRRILAYSQRPSGILPAEPSAVPGAADERALREIFNLLRLRTGHDFTNYKRATILRRIERRMGVSQVATLPAYAGYVRDVPSEPAALLRDLLISVTNFFRDPGAFAALDELVIAKLFEDRDARDQVRVWVAGCATGEEAYSVAMLLCERASGWPAPPDVQVFATDIDQNAIRVAREGVYTLNDAADLSAERLDRFFVKEGDKYRVRNELREMILFAHHNVLKDPPFSHLDLVTCRNLLIYLNRQAQDRVLETLHFAVNPGGYLFLGSSESIEHLGDRFVAVNKDARLFQSRRMALRRGLPLPERPAALIDRAALEHPSEETRKDERMSYGSLHHRLVEQYASPSVVVNDAYDIVHLSEHVGRYLQFAAGEPSRNLLNAVHPSVRLELRTALYQAAQQGLAVAVPGLRLPIGQELVPLTLLVRPVVKEDDPARGFFVVLFQEGAATAEPLPAEAIRPLEPAARQLEDELIRSKSQLRAAIEQYETQASDLKASNEELLAMNEELRSTAEELETSKEELQSVNEELTTVNQELKTKIEEETQSRNDLHNLINSTDIGTLFLDRSSRIQFFTPRAREAFHLIASDRGRPLSDITSRLKHADLAADVARVLERLEPIEREVQSDEGRWHLIRLLPYRTEEDRIDGVVLTFLDITERKLAEDQLRNREQELRLIFNSVTEYAIIGIDQHRVIRRWNRGAERMFGYSEDEALGQPVDILFTPDDRAAGAHLREFEEAMRGGRAQDERWHVHKDGTRFFVSGILERVESADGDGIALVKVARDLTERRRYEEALNDARDQLEQRVEERTRELGESNARLESEIVERRTAEAQIKSLLDRLISVQEEERRRIARDLHDHLGQQMTALRLALESIGEATDGATAGERLARARQFAAQVDSDVDFLIWELRPASIDELGLVPTLESFVGQWSKHFGIRAEFQATGMDGLRLPNPAETNFYRITQEALNNVYKHAGATTAAVMLSRYGDEVLLIIEDNGRGFSPKTGLEAVGEDRGLGLISMRERAALINGTLQIESAPDEGTTVHVRVRLAPVGDAAPASS
jgi:two-component system CheB/CheR fusion protein